MCLSEEDRFRLRCLCLQRVSPSSVVQNIKSLSVTDWSEFQEWFIDSCFNNDYYNSSQGDNRCTDSSSCSSSSCGVGDALYWKHLLHTFVKASGGIMSECMADALISLDGILEEEDGSIMEKASWLHKTYMYGPADRKSRALTLHITANSNMFQGSTGCFEWDAGYYLAEYIMSHADTFRSRLCIELGCGCGMVGAVISRLDKSGTHPVICTDGDWETLGNCEHNMKQNNINVVEKGDMNQHGVALMQFQWEEGWKSFQQQIEDVMLSMDEETPVSLVGADLLYDPDIIPVIVPLISEFLESMRDRPECSVYLSTRRRSEDTLQKFLNAVDAFPHVQIDHVHDTSISRQGGSGWRFYHIPSLDESHDSIILHRLTYKVQE